MAPQVSPHIVDDPPTFSFVLQPEFSLSALVLATEALRIANQNSGRTLFRWYLISESGEPMRASNGMWLPVDRDIDNMPATDFCLLFGGNLPTQRNSEKLLNYLKSTARTSTVIGAVDTGAFAVAQAGLLAAKDVALHWEAALALQERFPDSRIRDQLYLMDAKRVHCAGGVATLDLMLALIARQYGEILASEVANALVHTPRSADTPQRSDHPRERGTPPLIDRIVRLMESNLDAPLSLAEMADRLSVSVRTLSRECRRHFHDSPMRLYLTIRLQAARNLLFYEEFSIRDVGTACGFSYTTVLSRAFKQRFGETPSAFRANLRKRQSETFRPEVRRLSTDA